ncbi:MAG: DJ-1/PfpI family protein [Acidobacteriaceae bacterium]
MKQHLRIGGLIFSDMDQIDFTGPFEVLSRLRNSTFHVIAKTRQPIRDQKRLILTPEMTFGETPQLDVLLVPGGHGQEALMDDEETLSFIRSQFGGGAWLFSVCTGALTCGAAGLLKGVRATTHWRVLHLLPFFGAIPVDERVVRQDRIVSAGGVTAGIDGALYLASLLRGEAAAQEIQLMMQYATEPIFPSGHPRTAPVEILEAAKRLTNEITQRRQETAERISQKLNRR